MLTWSFCDKAPPPLAPAANRAPQNLFHHVPPPALPALPGDIKVTRSHGWGAQRHRLTKQEVPKSSLNKSNLGLANAG